MQSKWPWLLSLSQQSEAGIEKLRGPCPGVIEKSHSFFEFMYVSMVVILPRLPPGKAVARSPP